MQTSADGPAAQAGVVAGMIVKTIIRSDGQTLTCLTQNVSQDQTGEDLCGDVLDALQTDQPVDIEFGLEGRGGVEIVDVAPEDKEAMSAAWEQADKAEQDWKMSFYGHADLSYVGLGFQWFGIMSTLFAYHHLWQLASSSAQSWPASWSMFSLLASQHTCIGTALSVFFQTWALTKVVTGRTLQIVTWTFRVSVVVTLPIWAMLYSDGWTAFEKYAMPSMIYMPIMMFLAIKIMLRQLPLSLLAIFRRYIFPGIVGRDQTVWAYFILFPMMMSLTVQFLSQHPWDQTSHPWDQTSWDFLKAVVMTQGVPIVAIGSFMGYMARCGYDDDAAVGPLSTYLFIVNVVTLFYVSFMIPISQCVQSGSVTVEDAPYVAFKARKIAIWVETLFTHFLHTPGVAQIFSMLT